MITRRDFLLLIVVTFIVLIQLSARLLPEKPTAKTEEIESVCFSDTLSHGDHAYVDVVSINPVLGFHRFGNSMLYSLLCECQTVSGETMYVHISSPHYRQFVEPYYVPNIIYTSSNLNKITFSDPRRLYGKVRDKETLSNDYTEISINNIPATIYIDVNTLDDPSVSETSAVSNPSL